MTDLLQEIQQLQFTDRGAAEALLLDFVRETFPDLQVVSVQLQPLAVSLNSFNGFLTLVDGTRYFFKTHTEADNVIGEYYRAGVLADAGYPVIQPLFRSTEAGKHLLIYDVIQDPSVFDVAWEIENGRSDDLEALTVAQNRADDDLMRLYRESIAVQSEAESADAPIHQLFHFRLAQGRMERFYGLMPNGNVSRDESILLPGNEVPTLMSEVRDADWVINNQRYNDTLGDIVQRALRLLHPRQGGPSVVGHGDAHNGNVFWLKSSDPRRLLYFDPAFAGRHHPLLDLTKPLFHNVYAMWMYFPKEKLTVTDIRFQVSHDGVWHVDYDYDLPAVRKMFLRSKLERTLVPTLQLLAERNELADGWREMLKAALFCCPFLTMNLADSEHFSPEIALLGLAMCIEMGAESHGTLSPIDVALDEATDSL
jgi:hypothetical protein